MNNFRKGGNDRRSGGNRGSFSGGFSKDRDSRPVVMHQAICASCKKSCEVPFRPTGDKPVYCRDCFAGRAAMGGDRSDRRDPRSNRRDDNRESRGGFKDYGERNSSSNISQNSGNSEEVKRQLDSMNIKLDKLVYTIQTLTNTLNKSNDAPKADLEVAPTTIVKSEKKKASKKKAD